MTPFAGFAALTQRSQTGELPDQVRAGRHHSRRSLEEMVPSNQVLHQVGCPKTPHTCQPSCIVLLAVISGGPGAPISDCVLLSCSEIPAVHQHRSMLLLATTFWNGAPLRQGLRLMRC